jgi:cell division protein FtsN
MIEGPTLPLYARYIFLTVMVIWLSLAGGSWIGRAVIASQVLGQKDDQVEFRSMPEPRARPWVKVDPELEKEMEALREAAGPSLAESLSKQPARRQPQAAATPGDKEPSVLATPATGQVVPPKDKVVLQFGSFADPDNADKLREQLKAQGQESSIEKIDSDAGLLYRVKGPSFDNPEEAERVARNLRMQSFQVMVVGE